VAANTDRHYLDWAAVTSIATRLASAISADGLPDVVIGILRGGMIPAVCLAHALSLREVRALDVRHTARDGTNAVKTREPVISNSVSLGDLKGLDVLLVDDVAGTGQTMGVSRDLVADRGARRVRTAAWTLNAANWPHDGGEPGSTFAYVGATYRKWVIFPWEDQ
jgi:hypoxanthine phosphoribosyltransferase